jgi:hypothetical protein
MLPDLVVGIEVDAFLVGLGLGFVVTLGVGVGFLGIGVRAAAFLGLRLGNIIFGVNGFFLSAITSSCPSSS